MIKELRKMRAKGGRDRSVANYISELQHRGKLRKSLRTRDMSRMIRKSSANGRKRQKWVDP